MELGSGVFRTANALQVWYRPGSRSCGGRSATRADQHRSNAKRRQGNLKVAPASETRAGVPAFSGGSGVDGSMSSNKFVPAGATQVVYNTRNEGLQFADGSRQPLRRLRYQTQQTWQWRNPSTGASLRVSYPSEEVVLIPVSGQ